MLGKFPSNHTICTQHNMHRPPAEKPKEKNISSANLNSIPQEFSHGKIYQRSMSMTWYAASCNLQGLYRTAGTENNLIHLHSKRLAECTFWAWLWRGWSTIILKSRLHYNNIKSAIWDKSNNIINPPHFFNKLGYTFQLLKIVNIQVNSFFQAEFWKKVKHCKQKIIFLFGWAAATAPDCTHSTLEEF